MDIRLDKCCTYAAAKQNGVYAQFEPLLLIDSQPVPVVSINESFTYLGKIFDFEMRNDRAKRALTEKLSRLLEIISSLKIKAQLKLKILKLYIFSQITHELKMYAFGETWIIQNLDSSCATHIQGWLGMPVSSCIKEFSSLPRNKGGLGIPSFADQYKTLILAKRSAMKNSSQLEIRQIWSDTTQNNIATDTRLFKDMETREVQRKLKNDRIKKPKYISVRSCVKVSLLDPCPRTFQKRLLSSGWERWSHFRIISSASFAKRSNNSCLQHQIWTDGRELMIRTVHSVTKRLCKQTSTFYRTARQPSIDIWSGTTTSFS